MVDTVSDPHAPEGGPADRGHISGIIVHAVPERAAEVAERIQGLDGAEVAGREGGRLVVVLEALDEHGLADTVHRISLFENVYSAALVAHYVDAPEVEATENEEPGTGRAASEGKDGSS